MRWLWITDDWDRLDHPSDSTMRLLQEACIAGVKSYWCAPHDLLLDGHRVVANSRPVTVGRGPRNKRDFILDACADVDIGAFDRVVFRPDPPLTRGTVHAVQLLIEGLTLARRVPDEVVVNSPSSLLLRNEKLLAATNGNELPTIVSSLPERIAAFVAMIGTSVRKPLHLHQGNGICLVNSDSSEIARPDSLPPAHQVPVLLQRFIPEYAISEKRIWMVDGIPIACCDKVFADKSFPPDIDKGGRLVSTSLTPKEQETVRRLGERLVGAGIRIAGIDLIGGVVTDVNFHSPGLLVELERVHQTNLAALVISALLQGSDSGAPLSKA